MRFARYLLNRTLSPFLLAFALHGCGGSGGGSGVTPLTINSDSTRPAWVQGEYEDSETYKGYCASPSSSQREGSAMDEKMWLRSWTNDLYLWYDEVPDRNPAGYNVLQYFDLLKTSAVTPSGNDKDRFHFYYETSEWELIQSGIVSGYGVRWAVDDSGSDLIVDVALVEPGSPADMEDLKRGDRILTVDGVSVANARNSQSSIDILNNALVPSEHDEEHTFRVRSKDGTIREFQMISEAVPTSAVYETTTVNTGSGVVGYIAFNAHNRIAQDGLIQAIEDFELKNVSDLVLDLRYNGGGTLAVASQLAYMIAGNEATSGKAFENIVFNDKHTEYNPFTGERLEPLGFIPTALSWLGQTNEGTPLPSLNLNRVYILAGGGTCSASESLINSMRGIDVEVILIGSTTCGKPYGFYATENCGYTYFSINLRGENDKGFGDFTDGFSPQNSPNNQAGVEVQGCYVEDDLQHELGDPNEALFAQALSYRESSICQPVQSAISGTSQKLNNIETDPVLKRLTQPHPVFNSKVYNH